MDILYGYAQEYRWKSTENRTDVPVNDPSTSTWIEKGRDF